MKVSNPTARIGEEIACKLLKNKGFKILERNFRKSYGEIDIIATDRETLVFVEVKTRSSNKFGEPEESITPYKMKSIIKTAQYYKALNPKTPEQMRIDAVLIMLNGRGESTKINHLENIS